MKDLHSEAIDRLFDALKLLDSREEYYEFFEDVCTVKELIDIAQRFRVAELLDSKMNCVDISKLTGVSTATVSRVNSCLNYGSGGYKLAIDRLKGTSEETGEK